MKKQTGIMIAGAVVLVLGGWWGYNQYAAAQAAARSSAASKTAEVTTSAQEDVIWASGKLLPIRWTGLSPAVGGTIRTISVAEGDNVEAGMLLVELDNKVLQSQVDVAAAAVTEAEAARDRLLAGAMQAELAAARAEVAAAQGGLVQTQAAMRQAQDSVVVAEAQVSIAQAVYNELASRPTPAERVAGERDVALAQAAVKQAQSAYDEVKGDTRIGARPEALALEQATLRLDSAKSALVVATQGATQQQLAVAQAQVNAAKAQVQVAKGQVPSAEASVKSAEAQVARAQAALDRLQAGATIEDRAAAEARIKSTQAALAAAQAQLDQARIVAPFAGRIGTISARQGEQAISGQAVLILGDMAEMHVETTDLRETDVSRLKVGMPVEVTFDSLPGHSFRGTVAKIAPMSTVEKGSTNYTVAVDVADLDPSLRWGMTAFVNIQVK